MGIFDRMGKVIASNVNTLLDRAEDPKKSVDLLVEEMKGQIKLARKELVEAMGAEKVLRNKVDELDQEAEKWARRAELALKADDEPLAREALVQKKRVVAERDRAEALRAEQRTAALNMKGELGRMEARQQELEARKSTLATQLRQARAGGGAEGLGARPGGGGAFDELRRMEHVIEAKQAEVAAAREVDEALRGGAMSPDELEAKFAALEGAGASPDRPPGAGSDIDDELSALKRKIRIGS